MQFAITGHVTGTFASSLDLTFRLPWLYIILSLGSKLVYIGETCADGGLAGRLGQHFGPYVNSTLKRRAEDTAGVYGLRGPFIVIAARLPEGDDAPFDASSKQIRLACEALLHEQMGREFISSNHEWTIVSRPQGSKISDPADMGGACQSIYEGFAAAHRFLEPLSVNAPMQIVLLEERQGLPAPSEEDLGRCIEEIEVCLFGWIVDKLKSDHGDDAWWSEGVPENIRVQCATRREQEGNKLPSEAYLTLVDFRDIAKKNWQLFEAVFEQVAGASGKEGATKWLVDLNERRKTWAHPVKRIFAPVDSSQVAHVRALRQRVRKILSAG